MKKSSLLLLGALSSTLLCGCGPAKKSSSSSSSKSYEDYCPLSETFDFSIYNKKKLLQDFILEKNILTPEYQQFSNGSSSSSKADGNTYFTLDDKGAYVKTMLGDPSKTYFKRNFLSLNGAISTIEDTAVLANDVTCFKNDSLIKTFEASKRYLYGGAYMSETLFYSGEEADKAKAGQSAVYDQEKQVTRTGFCEYKDKINTTYTWQDSSYSSLNYKETPLGYTIPTFKRAMTLYNASSLFDRISSCFPSLDNFIDVTKVKNTDLSYYETKNRYSYSLTYKTVAEKEVGILLLEATAVVNEGGVNKNSIKRIEATFDVDMLCSYEIKTTFDNAIISQELYNFSHLQDGEKPASLVIHDPSTYPTK